MKKRFPALFLALTLCLGLAVPAFAADGDAYPTFKAPENSGIIYQTETMPIQFIGFGRSGNNNAHIFYDTYGDAEKANVSLAPKGVDIVVNGVKSAEEIFLRTFSIVDLKEGPFKEGKFKDLPGGTYLFSRLFVWESGKDVSLVPLNTNDPMEFGYDDPKDGKTNVAGTITAADAGFQVNENGSVILNSEWLYGLLGEGDLLQVVVGEQVVIGKIYWMYRLSGEPCLVSDVFTDVKSGNWLSDPVAWALMNDITTGTSDTSFSPDDNCTQAQILTFLYRAAREEQVESSARDMELAVQWAQEKGMIDDSFDGSTPCTRATAVSYIWQAFNKPAAGAPASFTDVDDNASFAGAVSWALENGVTNGTSDTTFGPSEVCNRGQIVTFLHRAYVEEARLATK